MEQWPALERCVARASAELIAQGITAARRARELGLPDELAEPAAAMLLDYACAGSGVLGALLHEANDRVEHGEADVLASLEQAVAVVEQSALQAMGSVLSELMPSSSSMER